MNEELDSQLSAMFDDELPPAECELLARRLSRDEALKARWGRYAVIGAVLRAERGVRLNAALAGRVNVAISAEPALGATAVPARASAPRVRWWQPLAGGALAASVAAGAILFMRAQAPSAGAPLAAQSLPSAVVAPVVNVTSGPLRNTSYVTPRLPAARPMLVPSTELANYVVAHSMVSSPVARHNLLSAFITSEPAAEAGQAADHAARAAP